MLTKLHIWITIILFFISNWVYCQNNPPNKIYSEFEQIKLLRNNGELDKAISLGEIYLVKHPKDADVLLLMGLMSYQKKEFTKSYFYLSKALNLAPNYLDVKLALIRLYIAGSEFSEAQKLISTLQKKDLQDSRVVKVLSIFHKSQIYDKIYKVKKSSLPSIKMPSQFVSSPSKKVQELRLSGNNDQALDISLSYLQQHPNSKDVDILLMVGLIYYQKKDYDLSYYYLNRALKLSPNYLDVKLALINIAIVKNNFKKAKELISSLHSKELQELRVVKILTKLKNTEEHAFLIKNPSYLISVAQSLKKTPFPLKDIQKLRMQGKIDRALEIGLTHLRKYPNNPDALFMVGLIYYQKNDFSLANYYLNKALKITPDYLDVKLTLIRVAIAEKRFNFAARLLTDVKARFPKDERVKEIQISLNKAIYQNKIAILNNYYKNKQFLKAKKLALQILAQNANDEDIRIRLANIYLALKNYQEARRELEYLLAKNIYNKRAWLALINLELTMKHDRRAMFVLDRALYLFPNDPDFLIKQAELYEMQHKYPMAAHTYKRALTFDVNKKTAWNQLNQLRQLNPHYLYGLNEAGVISEYDSISDLKNNWEYSNFYYTRNNKYGSLYLGINNADRFGINGNQAYISLTPVINKDFYMQFSTGYANQPVLFPTYYFGGEGFFAGLPAELSAGYSFSYIIPNISFSLYTLSISKEIGDYWISFRPNFYRPLFGKTSLLYTLSLVQYYNSKDFYSRVTLGSGTAPNLADLLTVNFLVIKNNFITYFIQVPLFEHKLLFTAGFDYQHWVFTESGRVREITGGLLGLNYRFEG